MTTTDTAELPFPQPEPGPTPEPLPGPPEPTAPDIPQAAMHRDPQLW